MTSLTNTTSCNFQEFQLPCLSISLSTWGYQYMHTSLPLFTRNSPKRNSSQILNQADRKQLDLQGGCFIYGLLLCRGSLLFLPLTEAFVSPTFFALPALSRPPSDSVYAGLYPPDPSRRSSFGTVLCMLPIEVYLLEPDYQINCRQILRCTIAY